MHNNNLIHYTVPDSDDILSEMTVHNLEGKELEMMPQPDISVASLYVSTFEVPECSTTKLGWNGINDKTFFCLHFLSPFITPD